jgi:hypothetical protein
VERGSVYIGRRQEIARSFPYRDINLPFLASRQIAASHRKKSLWLRPLPKGQDTPDAILAAMFRPNFFRYFP